MTELDATVRVQTWNAKFRQLSFDAGAIPVKRSALIPMMIYAQDEFGFLGDEILEEIAQRLDLNTIAGDRNARVLLDAAAQARGKVSHSGLHQCFVHGCAAANELLEHVQKRLGIGHKEMSPSGTFSLEEVECMGACTGAPAMQVNYDFYENLDADKVDAIFEQLQEGKKPQPAAVTSGAVHDAIPPKCR